MSGIRNREGRAARQLTEMQEKISHTGENKENTAEETGCLIAGLKEEFYLKEKQRTFIERKREKKGRGPGEGRKKGPGRSQVLGK